MLFGVNVIQGYIIPFSCSVSRVMFPVCGTVRGWESVNTLLATQSVEASSTSQTLRVRSCHRGVQRGLTLIGSVAQKPAMCVCSQRLNYFVREAC